LTNLKEQQERGVVVHEVELEAEPGIRLQGRLHLPDGPGRKPAVLLVVDRLISPRAEKIAAAGQVVLEWQPRMAPSGDDKRPYLGDWVSNTRADMIGRTLAVLRARDILRGVDVLAARPEVDAADLRAAAEGVPGVWLLLAAAHDQRISRVWLDRTPFSLRTALENSFNTRLHDAVIPGFILRWDLEDLVAALGERKVLWTDPANWMGRVAPLKGHYRYRYLNEPDDGILAEFLGR
jgi:hypothetical protein